MGVCQGKPGRSFYESSNQSHKDEFNSPSNKAWQHVCNVANQETSLPLVPGALTGADYVPRSSPTWHVSRFQTPRRKQVISINNIISANNLDPMCRSSPFWEWWEPSPNPSSQSQSRPTLETGPSQNGSQARYASFFSVHLLIVRSPWYSKHLLNSIFPLHTFAKARWWEINDHFMYTKNYLYFRTGLHVLLKTLSCHST